MPRREVFPDGGKNSRPSLPGKWVGSMKKSSKKLVASIVVVLVIAAAGAAAWCAYSRSQKSGFVKGAEKVEEWGKNVGRDTKKLFK